jgi:hypothetical protein
VVDLRLSNVGYRREFSVIVGMQSLTGSARAAASAANQAYLDGVGYSLRLDNGGKSAG